MLTAMVLVFTEIQLRLVEMENSIILETFLLFFHFSTKQKLRKERIQWKNIRILPVHLFSMRVIDIFSGTITRCCFRQ